MATADPDFGGGDGPEEVRETTRLIPERPKVEPVKNVQQSLYQSLNLSVDASSLAGEADGRSQGNLIGPPQPNSQDVDCTVPEVVIENKTEGKLETTTDLQCLMHILKGNIGTGVLAMPVAMKHAGLWTGLFGVLFIGFVAVYCMHLLVKSGNILRKRSGHEDIGYADVMELCLTTGPERFQWIGIHARRFVNVLLLFTQFGFCCVYIVFISASIKDVVDIYTPHGPDARIYELGVAALLIPYCLIRDLGTLSPFSVFANVLTLVGMALIFVNLLSGVDHPASRPAFSSVKELPLFFGTAIFAFEGISLVLPLESSMENRGFFSAWCGVLNASMVTVTCLYACVGFFGYLKFGDAVKGSITLNLPSSPWYFLIVKPMFAISIFVSYNVQFYVPIRIITPFLTKRLKRYSERKVEYILRVFFVILTMALAMAIPELDLLISLVGAVASSSLALILPIVIHLITFSQEPGGISTIAIIRSILIIMMGVIGFATGTYSSLVEIIAAY